MGWDDLPPDAGVATAAPAWDAAPPTDEELNEGVLGKAARNFVPDLKQVFKGMGDVASGPGADIASGDVGSAIPKLIKQGKDFFANPQENAETMIRPITHPVEYFEEHPVQQTLNAAGAIAGLEGMASKALPAAEARVPLEEAPRTPLEEAPKEPNPQTPPLDTSAKESRVDSLIDAAMGKADDVKNYISKSYETAAKKPGMTSDLADLAQEKSQMMAVKAAGGGPLFATQGIRAGKTPIQINNELRAVGQYMLDNDIVKPELGNKFMLQRQEDLMNAAGQKLGAIRKMADEMRDPAETPVDTLQEIQKRLGEQYGEGMPGSGEYQTALKIVASSEPTFSGAAEVATKLNKLANKANRNFQPHTAYTDVANAISDINNERISEVVGPKIANEYEQALREYGVNKKIQNMLGRKVGQQLHRTGPGSLTRAAYQKFMDEVGYKGGAKVMNKMAGDIKNNPAVAKNLPSLFKTFINEVEDILPEREGMAQGGVVEDSIHHHLRREFDPNYAKATQGL